MLVVPWNTTYLAWPIDALEMNDETIIQVHPYAPYLLHPRDLATRDWLVQLHIRRFFLVNRYTESKLL